MCPILSRSFHFPLCPNTNCLPDVCWVSTVVGGWVWLPASPTPPPGSADIIVVVVVGGKRIRTPARTSQSLHRKRDGRLGKQMAPPVSPNCPSLSQPASQPATLSLVLSLTLLTPTHTYKNHMQFSTFQAPSLFPSVLIPITFPALWNPRIPHVLNVPTPALRPSLYRCAQCTLQL